MSGLLQIGTSAVNAYQGALSTVSNNIANIGTEGYSRQEVSLEAGSPVVRGALAFGSGVAIAGIRRAYDEFTTENLRVSHSALNAQEPLLNYANNVIDILGGAQSGLSSAVDDFFGSAQQLSATPASIDARDRFLRSADELTSRFRSLSGELGRMERETRGDLKHAIDSLNSLASQLAIVNGRLMSKPRAAEQPSTLLDQRDQLLDQMSRLATVKVTIEDNGEATVSLGMASKQTLLVVGDSSREVGAIFDDRDPAKIDIVLDPNGSTRPVNSLQGGKMAGLMTFRQQVLAPSLSKLDGLAQSLSEQLNAVHTSGMDLDGNTGSPLVIVTPHLRFEQPASRSDVSVDAEVIDPAATVEHDVELRWFEQSGIWVATDLTTGKKEFGAKDASEIEINGTRLTMGGTPSSAETIIMRADHRPSETIRMALTDPRKVAAAALFRVIASDSNIGGARAAVDFRAPSTDSAPGPAKIDSVLVNNPNPAASIPVNNNSITRISGIATVLAGYTGISIQLANSPGSHTDLQVFTRDGRHLIGTALDATTQQLMLSTGNGFITGAGYSDQYLNLSGSDGYRQLSVFYGARAERGGDPRFDAENQLVDTRDLRAHLDGDRIPATTAGPLQTLVAGGTLTLNGQVLANDLTVPDSGRVQATDIAAWINGQLTSAVPVAAAAVNDISISAEQLSLGTAGAAVTIQGIAFGTNGLGFANADEVASQINAYSASHQPAFTVQARVDREGALILTNTAGHEGEDIAIGVPPGFIPLLGIAPGNYTGKLLLQSEQPIRFGIAPGGTAADLNRLGIRAGAWIDGAAPEDLLVFATGDGTAQVAAAYSRGVIEPLASQRAQPLQVTFGSNNRYTITDRLTGTVLADRDWNPEIRDLEYRGLTLTFDRPPQPGDTFIVDANRDGIGNNANIRRLAELEQAGSFAPGGNTLSESYRLMIAATGNVAGQAKIARDALAIVEQQATEAREKAAGVNLDNEAADLIRFQQAYQAAARTIQVSTQLFDAIAQIR